MKRIETADEVIPISAVLKNALYLRGLNGNTVMGEIYGDSTGLHTDGETIKTGFIKTEIMPRHFLDYQGRLYRVESWHGEKPVDPPAAHGSKE